MHGRPLRRRIVRLEFITAAPGCLAIGILALVNGSGVWIAIGAWLLGVGANYVPLALEAQRLSRAGALDAAMHGVDPRGELRETTRSQLWIAVPLAIVIAGRRREPTRE